ADRDAAGAILLRRRHGDRDGHAAGLVRRSPADQSGADRQPPQDRRVRRAPTSESRTAKAVLVATALLFLALFVALPLIAVFSEALERGFGTFVDAITQPDAQSAIRLTLLIAAISVPLNMVFGVAASWAITKFEFPGKGLLITLIDLPFSVSPVVSGLIFVLL